MSEWGEAPQIGDVASNERRVNHRGKKEPRRTRRSLRQSCWLIATFYFVFGGGLVLRAVSLSNKRTNSFFRVLRASFLPLWLILLSKPSHQPHLRSLPRFSFAKVNKTDRPNPSFHLPFSCGACRKGIGERSAFFIQSSQCGTDALEFSRR